MGYKYNVSYCEATTKVWTPTAVDCYRIGCNCSKCNIYKLYFKDSTYNCKMKDVVFELVRKFGVPTVEKGELSEKFI
jgi:hypothetical protein